MFNNVVFFFSSRRRHTRWNCDWSSDVCSSDLVAWGGDIRRERFFGGKGNCQGIAQSCAERFCAEPRRGKGIAAGRPGEASDHLPGAGLAVEADGLWRGLLAGGGLPEKRRSEARGSGGSDFARAWGARGTARAAGGGSRE